MNDCIKPLCERGGLVSRLAECIAPFFREGLGRVGVKREEGVRGGQVVVLIVGGGGVLGCKEGNCALAILWTYIPLQAHTDTHTHMHTLTYTHTHGCTALIELFIEQTL